MRQGAKGRFYRGPIASRRSALTFQRVFGKLGERLGLLAK
jgi:hypothetical protein